MDAVYDGLRLLGYVLVALLALVGALHVTRMVPIRRLRVSGSDRAPAIGEAAFLPTMEALSGVTLAPGHRIELLHNGDGTFPRLFAELERARRSIMFQIYYAEPGAVADRLGEILRERARSGVRVHFLYDAWGARDLRSSWLEQLRESGVQTTVLRPVRLRALATVTNRCHVRAVVVDGRVGFTGGFGVADKWLGDGQRPGEWRDTNVCFEGRAVASLQAANVAAWAEATGELLAGEDYFPPGEVPATEGAWAALLYTPPVPGSTSAERFVALTIAGARRRLWIANSYFTPNDAQIALLVGSARRGVDVRVLTPNEHTDVPIVYVASRSCYDPLLSGGVRIWEYQPAMMHSKTVVADSVWAAVGSMNVDNRSLTLDDETTLLAHDPTLAGQLEESFLADLERAQEVTLEQFRQRPMSSRLLEWLADRFERIL